MTYMNPEESNRIITWASREFARCIFVVYEQIVPNVCLTRCCCCCCCCCCVFFSF
jgi:hypothetical protein